MVPPTYWVIVSKKRQPSQIVRHLANVARFSEPTAHASSVYGSESRTTLNAPKHSTEKSSEWCHPTYE